jgi:hypothetical protein
MQGRAPRRAVEGPPERLAVDGQNPRPIGPEIVQERPERPSEGRGVEQPEHTRERVVARQPILKVEKFPQ